MLFELGNVAEIYFAERVVLCEGKTDRRILPLAYERIYGKGPDHEHIAFVAVGSCSDIRKSLAVLRAMDIPACAIADLDFAFTHATKGGNPLIAETGRELTEAKAILSRLQPLHGFLLSGNGLPTKGNGFRAADTWGHMCTDPDGSTLAADVHAILKVHGIYVWKAGCIEHVTGTASKGEDAIIACEATLRTMATHDISHQMPELVDCFDWLRTFDPAVNVI